MNDLNPMAIYVYGIVHPGPQFSTDRSFRSITLRDASGEIHSYCFSAHCICTFVD